MSLPVLKGLIRRRVLLNFRVEPGVVAQLLPQPFHPQLVGHFTMVGICVIRLEKVRPAFMPLPFGIDSENGAHRFAVTWRDKEDRDQTGVYIPRRDTNSLLNRLAGDRLFPGAHHPALFRIRDDQSGISFTMSARDGSTELSFKGKPSNSLPQNSIFSSTEQASQFFRNGCLGFSSNRKGNRLDAVRLETHNWAVQPFEVERVYSSYFSDERLFPKGTITFDHALLMRNIDHEWHIDEQHLMTA